MELNFIVSSVSVTFGYMGFNVETHEYLHSDLHTTYIDALRDVVRVLSALSGDNVVVHRHWHKNFGASPEVGRYLKIVVFDLQEEKVDIISVCGHYRI